MSDLHFDRALRGAARRGRPEGVCPDAAALASYVNRSLSPTEHAALEAHVASCAACIEHLALLAAVDAPEAPADTSDAWSFERIFGNWRWLVPVATIVLVVAVWMRLPGSREAAQPVSQEKPAEASKPVAFPPSAGGAPSRGQSGDKSAELEQSDARARLDAVSKLEASRQKPSEAVPAAVRPGRFVQGKGARRRSGQRAEESPVAGARPVAAPAPPPPPPSAPRVAEEAKPDAGARTESRAAADAAAAAPAAKDTKVQGMAETVAVPQAAGVGGSALALRKAMAGRRSRSRLPASACALSAAVSTNPAMAAQRGRRSEPASRRGC